MVNGREFALGVISGAGVSVQLGLAGRAVASTGSATEKASQSGIVIRTESEPIQSPVRCGCLVGANEDVGYADHAVRCQCP
jgi:hypothetical protein